MKFPFFRAKLDPFDEKAEIFVKIAKVDVVSSYISYSQQYPLIKTYDPDRWDRVMVIASAVFTVNVLIADNQVDKERMKTLITTIGIQLGNEYKEPHEEFQDCNLFIHQKVADTPEYKKEPNLKVADLLGTWIVSKLSRHASLTADERQLVRALGLSIGIKYQFYWR